MFRKMCVFALLVTLFVGVASAAPRATLTGPEPIYDSGWVQSNNGLQTFNHYLESWPTHIEVYVADDSDGTCPSLMFDVAVDGDNHYGGSIRDVSDYQIKIYWHVDGIAYNHELAKWYERGDAFVRVLVFSADGEFGNPPIRP